MLPPDLLHGVLAAPEQDGPRRVLADALLEAGDPRGELILLQLRGAASSWRERELLRLHGARWMAGLGPLALPGPHFSRGFLTGVRIDRRAGPLVVPEPELSLVERLEATSGPDRPDVFGALVGLRAVQGCHPAEVPLLQVGVRSLQLTAAVPAGALSHLPALETLCVPLGDRVELGRALLSALHLAQLDVGVGEVARWGPLGVGPTELVVRGRAWSAHWPTVDGQVLELRPVAGRARGAGGELVQILASLPLRALRRIHVTGGRPLHPAQVANDARRAARGTPIRLPAWWTAEPLS